MCRDNQAMTGIVVKHRVNGAEILGQKDDFILENEQFY